MGRVGFFFRYVVLGLFSRSFCCFAGFFGFFWRYFATVQLLNSYCYASWLVGMVFGFFFVEGVMEGFNGFFLVPYSFLHFTQMRARARVAPLTVLTYE